MKRRNAVLLILALMLMFLANGCESRAWHEGVTQFDPATFNNAQMLEDYDYIWVMLEENCPLLNLCARKYDMNLEELKANMRQKVEVLKDGDIVGFKNAIAYLSRMFHSTGHIGIIGYDTYNSTGANGKWESSTIKELYQSEKVKSYFAIEHNSPQQIALRKTSQKPTTDEKTDTPAADESKKSTISEKSGTPIITIPTFNFRGDEGEREIKAVQQFFLVNLDSENIIIDIRNNNGGNTDIWARGIEPLLAGKVIEDYSIGACKNTDYNKKMWADWYGKDKNMQIYPIAELTKRNITSAVEGDLVGLDSAVISTQIFDYSKVKNAGGKTFTGEIWLLTNEQNFSSAEALVRLAKSSGFATIVGTRTNGGGAIIASPAKNAFALPNCGMIFQYSAFYAMNSDGTCNEEMGTPPDIAIADGEDALAVCLAEIAKRK